MRDLSRRSATTGDHKSFRPVIIAWHSRRTQNARARHNTPQERKSSKRERRRVMAPPPPKLSASNSSSSLADHFPNLRQFFQRSASQPSQYHDTSAHSSGSSPPNGAPSSPPRRASAAPSFSSSPAPSSTSVDPDADARMHAFGSCTQVLATAITALFRAINMFGIYQPESAVSDNTTTRRAKLLYVQLLDKAQRERGEWRGFADTSSSSSSSSPNREKANESALDILSTHLRDLSRDETFALLNELVDVSFRSIRGPLVSSEVYLKHKRRLAALSLDIPASLHVLLEIRGILNQLGRDEKLCVFRLLALWHAMAVANEAQDLRRTIQEKHHLVFSDCTELEFLTTRKDPRHDAVAIALLHILVLYHDVLFSDVEFLLIKQELQLSQSLRRPRVASDAEETDEPKAIGPSDDSTQTESPSPSPPQSEQTETEAEHSGEQTKSDDALDASKEQTPSRARSETVETRTETETVEVDESKVEAPSEGTAQAATPPPSSPSQCAERIDDQIEQGDELDIAKESAKSDEDNTTSSSLSQEELSPAAAAAVQLYDAEPTQSEERCAARDQETDIPNLVSTPTATENVSEERSPLPKPHEVLPDASSQSVARVSPSALTRSQSTNPPHHHNHNSARGHGSVVSIRPHSLSPRKTRQSKRLQFESLTVSTATTITAATSEKEQKQYNHHNHSHHNNSSSSKSNDARQATLLSDVVQIVDYFNASSKEPVARTNGNDSINSESPTAPAAIVRIQQHSPEANESSNAWLIGQQSTPGAARAASIKSSKSHEPHAEAGGTEGESPPEPPVKRASIAQSFTKPSSPRPHEITDLANTYFSFSFAAATMRTMAIMAVYAIRRHQHNHHQQHE